MIKRLWQDLHPAVKLGGIAVFLLSIGWSAHVLFAQQIGLPSVVYQTVERVDTLEHHVESIKDDMAMIHGTIAPLERIPAQIDSLFNLNDDTYCLVRCLLLNLNPVEECSLNRGRIRDGHSP